MTNDDVIYRSRLRLFALAKEMGSVRAACRMLGVHHSTYYRWRRLLLRYGPELLRPRERRQPRMPNAISPMVEQRILAMAIAFPGWGPNRISLELGRPKWGGIKVSGNGVWRLLRRHGLGHRAQRLALCADMQHPQNRSNGHHSRTFTSKPTGPVSELSAKHIYIRAGRPQSNGCVERVQQTLLEECWKPAFARYLVPKYTGLQRDLVQELEIYNSDRIHQGRRIKGMTPGQAIENRTLWTSNPQ